MKLAADLFCGAGGTTTGLLRAAARCGVKVDMLALNHWDLAIETHLMNHPDVRHLCESLDNVDPRKVVPGGRLDYLAASPECTHHSIAAGGRPKCDQSRASAWHVVRWAEALMPERIVVENVREFQHWGPLTKMGKPVKAKRGQTFIAFCAALESLGYFVDQRVMNAADFGDATTRNRLFVQAWKGRRVTWPDPSHAGRWRAAREVIDWSLKGQSIFNRARPLSKNTMRRIAAGLEKFSGIAFTMKTDQSGSEGPNVRAVSGPMATLVTKNNLAVCSPFLVKFHGAHEGRDQDAAFAARCHDVKEPLKTIDTSSRIGIAEPFVIGQQSCSAPRHVSSPLPTIVTDGACALVEPFLAKFNGTGGARPVSAPLDTITTKDRFGLCLPRVSIDGETFLLDVLFRMLQPHELKRAMGFDDGYQFAGNKGEQVRQIGNAVSVAVSEAIFMNIMGRRR